MFALFQAPVQSIAASSHTTASAAHCKPSKTTMCVRRAPLAKDTSQLIASTETRGSRLAFDLPRSRQLFKTKAKRKAFDAHFAAKLDAVKTSKKHGAASHNAAGTPSPSLIANKLAASDSVQHHRFAQKRKIDASVTVEGCPHPPGKSNPDGEFSAGSFHVMGHVTYTLSTAVQRGDKVFMTTVRVNTDLFQVPRAMYLIGNVNGDAKWDGDLVAGSTKENQLFVQVQRRDTVVNLKSGSRSTKPPLNYEFVVEDPFHSAYAITTSADSFDNFVAQNDSRDASEGDQAATPRIIWSSVDSLIRAFVKFATARIVPVVKAAQKNWQKPNTCLSLSLTAPVTALSVGQTTTVNGHVGDAYGSDEADILGSHPQEDVADWYGDLDPPNGKVDTIVHGRVQPGVPWFRYHAPKQAWTSSQHPGFHIHFTSTAGVAKARISFKYAAVRPATGSFSGSYDLSGIDASWNGTISYETLDSSGTVENPTTGHVSWTVSGTDSSGCTYKGSGDFGIKKGMLKGQKVGGYFTMNPPNTYYVELNTGGNGLVEGYNAFPVTVSCPHENSYSMDYPLSDWLDVSHSSPSSLTINNGVMDGSDSYSSGTSFSESWKWHLKLE